MELSVNYIQTTDNTGQLNGFTIDPNPYYPNPYYPNPYNLDYFTLTGTNLIYTCTKHEFRCVVEGDSMILSLDLPGVRPENIAIEIENSNLTLKAKRLNPAEEITKTYLVLGNFDLGSTKADLEYGVLTISLKKKDQKAHKVEITVK